MCMLKMDQKITREPNLGLKTRLFQFIQIQNVNQDVSCLCSINTSQNCHHLLLRRTFFYMRPKSATPSDPNTPWYESIPIGKETLRTMLANMCDKAGIERKTNHSLCATGDVYC